ncbi:MAG: hypothetical protein SGBAC_013477 [Bacillariaceae sp.]
MRKDTSTLESEFIQGGSHDDSNTNAHNNINSVENIAVGDCDSCSSIAKQRNESHTITTSEERDDEKSRLHLGSDHQAMIYDEDSLPFLLSLGSSDSSEAAEAVSPSAATAVTIASAKPKSAKSVSFSHCSIRSYNQILGDHPLCAVGCPIALGWRIMRQETLSVDDHESIREPLRKKKGAKSPLQSRRKRHSHDGHDQVSMEPCFKYINSQLKLSAQERRERLRDCSDVQIRKEWSRMQKQARRGLIKEGMRQFRMIGKEYAGY